jgi:penicillin-binding protein 1A
MTLREALLESSNAAAVLLQQRVGARPVIKLATEMGVPNQPNVPSLALGSGLVTPLALTAAYAVFPGMGYRSRPRGVVSVDDADGNQVDASSNAIRCSPAGGVPDGLDTAGRDSPRNGASVQRYGLPMEVGSKTEHQRLARRVVRRLLIVGGAGVWIGFDEPQTIRSDASGSRVALPSGRTS